MTRRFNSDSWLLNSPLATLGLLPFTMSILHHPEAAYETFFILYLSARVVEQTGRREYGDSRWDEKKKKNCIHTITFAMFGMFDLCDDLTTSESQPTRSDEMRVKNPYLEVVCCHNSSSAGINFFLYFWEAFVVARKKFIIAERKKNVQQMINVEWERAGAFGSTTVVTSTL